MKPGIPWSVKGIEPEAREAAKHAARRSGMTLGEWLNSTILERADGTESGEAEAGDEMSAAVAEPRMAAHYTPRNTTTLEDIAQQLSELARREQETAAHMPMETAWGRRDRDSETLNRIISRVDNNERQTVDAFSAVNDRLTVIGRQVAMAARAKVFERPEDVPGFTSLETAVRNVVAHIEASEARTRDSLKAMQDRMADMASRASAAPSGDMLSTVPAFHSLEEKIGELGQRLERQERRDDLPSAVQDEMNRLASRLDQIDVSAEAVVREAQTAGAAAARHEIKDIESRIQSVLRATEAAVASQDAHSADLHRLQAGVSELNNRIDLQLQGFAHDEDVQALHAAVEQLSSRVAQGPDLRPLADFDHRLQAIAAQVEDINVGHSGGAHFADLSQRIDDLDQRLDQVLSHPQDGGSLSALGEQLAAVHDRLGRAEEQLGHFATIERAITQLYDALEQGKDLARQTAEEAANRAAERVLQGQRETQSGESSPELLALQSGLQAVRESAQASDQRNQDTLAAVHETLEQIVTKLAELETSAAGHQLALNMAQNLGVGPASPAAETVAASGPANSEPAPAAAAPQGFDPEADSDTLAAPPAGDESGHSGPAESAHASDAAPSSDEAAPATEEAPVDDFIAAARRLAQAANSAAPLSAGPRPADAPAANSRFKMPFRFPKFERRPKPMVFSGGKLVLPEKPAAPQAMSRRTLVLAGIVLLLAAGALGLRLLHPQKPPQQNSSIENSVVMPAKPIVAQAQPAAPASENDNLITGSLPAGKTATNLSVAGKMATAAPAPTEPIPAAIGSQSLRDAAANGDAMAQFVVASRYLDGKGVAQDFSHAAYWYGQAASHGLAPAEYRLGTLMERGKGVTQNAGAALAWYEKAAAAGNVKAMHNAAVIAAGTQAGTPDYDKAFHWFSAAASHGLKDSEFNLGVLYERGLGTKLDLAEAFVWYSLAAKQGDSDAAARADAIRKQLPVAALGDLDARVAKWQAEAVQDAANVVTVNNPQWEMPVDALALPDDAQAPMQTAPAAPPTPKADAKTDTKTDAKTDPIRTIQQLLQKLGYSVGSPDGRMGARTASAIRLFQLQQGMKVTGEVTPELVQAMQAKAS